MGVLYDYFRAADDDAAIALMTALGGGPVITAANSAGPTSAALDAVDLKGVDPEVALGGLVGFVRGVAWQVDLVDSDLIWSAEEDGPWLLAIDDAARDSLAAISGDHVPALAARWGRTEEFAKGGPLPDDHLVPVVEAIAGLARRARDAGDHLYCWCCL